MMLKHVPLKVVRDLLAHKATKKDKQIFKDVQEHNQKLNSVPKYARN